MHARIGVDQRTVFVTQTVDVVTVVMAQDHIVDVLGFKTSSSQVGQELACGGWSVVREARVKQIPLVAVDQQKRGVRHVDVIGGQVL